MMAAFNDSIKSEDTSIKQLLNNTWNVTVAGHSKFKDLKEQRRGTSI